MANQTTSRSRLGVNSGHITRRFLTYLILAFGAVIALIPFLWMISTSFMSLGEAQGLTLIPSELRFENFAVAWERGNFTEYFVNSVLITVHYPGGRDDF